MAQLGAGCVEYACNLSNWKVEREAIQPTDLSNFQATRDPQENKMHRNLTYVHTPSHMCTCVSHRYIHICTHTKETPCEHTTPDKGSTCITNPLLCVCLFSQEREKYFQRVLAFPHQKMPLYYRVLKNVAK